MSLTDAMREQLRTININQGRKPVSQTRQRRTVNEETGDTEWLTFEQRVQKKFGSNYPKASVALGVQPHQVPEAMEEARKHGIALEFDEQTGEAIVSGPNKYKEIARTFDFYTGRDGFKHREGDKPVHSGMHSGADHAEKQARIEELKEAAERQYEGDAGSFFSGAEHVPSLDAPIFPT